MVGTINRFPSVSGDFVLGDERSLYVAMNAASPGTAVPNELWLAGPDDLGAKLERAAVRCALRLVSAQRSRSFAPIRSLAAHSPR